MTTNLRNVNLQSFYDMLSGIRSNERVNQRDKKLISRYVENLLREIHIEDHQGVLRVGFRRFSLSLYDKIYLLAAKSK